VTGSASKEKTTGRNA